MCVSVIVVIWSDILFEARNLGGLKDVTKSWITLFADQTLLTTLGVLITGVWLDFYFVLFYFIILSNVDAQIHFIYKQSRAQLDFF